MQQQILAPAEWTARAAAHAARADRLTRDHRARRSRGEKHPVWDFLFDYYPVRVSHLRRWHPGLGVLLEPGRDDAPPQASWRDYRVDASGRVAVDTRSLLAHRGESIAYIRNLLARTTTNPAHFDCFGMHEWAMVYRTNRPRHDLPLRLGKAGTNAVVASAPELRCTHFDAFRFFTAPARPLNFRVLTRDGQPDNDQCGCLHATMDLYKWATKLGPIVEGELWLDTFELACRARVLDMEASPYDCRGLGFGVVAVETNEGKAEYVSRQREIAAAGRELRAKLLESIRPLFPDEATSAREQGGKGEVEPHPDPQTGAQDH